MAASSAMQSLLLASPVTCVANRSKVIQFSPVKSVPRLQRNANLQVRCLAEGDQQQLPATHVTSSTPEPKPKPSPAAPKVSTKFSDVLAFSGPAPERINGRLAMVGFVAALVVELSKGQDVFTQISNGGIQLFLGTSIVLSLASLIPLFRGVTAESRSEGFMTSDAELWNGRLAMLGLVALAFTEYVKGGTLV
ncbi:early light-induced protein 1, chloroplastic-like [Durio zibethinus]|uniref:Early light-induced protein 1, chloroplastic-like n=1 Tax=Durio zibethinus TaxID=66656 RepID=A0A6P6A8E1_DURZI|nr:early light-induced protein 1, chloroplastic-like [Durio zibethinus]